MIPRLKHTSHAERLAMVLEEFCPEEIASYGRKAGIGALSMQQAIRGRLQATIPYLRLAAAMQYDPTEGGWPLDREMPVGDFDFVMLAMGLRMRRMLKGHTPLQAAQAMDIGQGLIARFERGDRLAIGPTMKVCRYVGHHPLDLIRQPEKIGKYAIHTASEPAVSRETVPRAIDSIPSDKPVSRETSPRPGDRAAASPAAAANETNTPTPLLSLR